MKTKSLVIGLGLGVIGLAGVGTVANKVANQAYIDECNTGVQESCEFILETRPALRGQLTEAGEATIAQMEDEALRAGENLAFNHTRQITPADKVTEDLKFTAIKTASNEMSVKVTVRWMDKVRRSYIFNSDGTGWSWNPDLKNSYETSSHNWSIDDQGNVVIVSENGWTTMMGGLGSEMTELQKQSEEKTRRHNEMEAAAIEAQREEQRYYTEAGIRAVRGVFGGW